MPRPPQEMESLSKLRRLVVASPGGTVGGGGTGSVSREIEKWLRLNQKDVPVDVLDARGTGRALFSPAFLAVAAAKLVGLRMAGANLLHVQVTERGSFVRKGLMQRLGRLMGMHTVLHHHGAEFASQYPRTAPTLKKWMADTVLGADLNLVLSEPMREFLIGSIGLSPDRVVVLHNAINDMGYSFSPRDDSALMRYALIANLSPRKGVTEFLRAMKQLIDQGHLVHGTLAGGESVARYTAEAAELGIADACTFTGWLDRPRIEVVLRQSDAVVLPSFDEGLPMVILEALSAGRPVIATPVGAIPEVLTSGHDCLLVEPGDVPALADAMLRLKTDPELASRLSIAGRRLYESKFLMDAYMQRLQAIYAAVLARPRIGT